MKKKIIISGVSGFISYHLINYLINKNYKIYGIDKKISKNLEIFKNNKNFTFFKINLSKKTSSNYLLKKFKNLKFDSFWHLAANSDISKGINNYEIELNDTFLTTINSINISKKLKIKKFIFSSSSAIFGDFKRKISEFSSPARPISNYGSMKLSSESYIYANYKNFDKLLIIRFPNVVGGNMTHGLLYDLIKKLKKNNKKINILGNGSQKKPYLHVSNLVSYMYSLYKKNLNSKISVFNIGPSDNGITVKEIVNKFIKVLKVKNIDVIYQKKIEGWKGDVVKYSYNTNLIKKTLNINVPSSKKCINQAIKDISIEL
tara:strand:- start:1239 stop:2189 length:951 start_codon:yes stop_codon:yes gene_type:complete